MGKVSTILTTENEDYAIYKVPNLQIFLICIFYLPNLESFQIY